jgi:hypothetical protein
VTTDRASAGLTKAMGSDRPRSPMTGTSQPGRPAAGRPDCRLCKGTGQWGQRNIDGEWDVEPCPVCVPEVER